MAKCIKHIPCPKCGSKDNVSVYDDGHHFCESINCDYQFWENGNTPININHREIRALRSKGISKSTCEFFSYETGFINDEPVEIANYFDNSRRVLQVIRLPNKEFPRMGDTNSRILFGEWKWKPNPKLSLVITEGERDCMAIAEMQNCKFPVVSINGGAKAAKKCLEARYEYLAGWKDIILCFDNDLAGQTAVQECISIFEPGYCRVTEFPLKDACDMWQAGRGKELQQAIWSAKVYRPDGLHYGNEYDVDFILEPTPRGYPLPYPELDKMMLGLFKGGCHVVTAVTGGGKTTLTKELGYHLLSQTDCRVGWIMMEESVKETIQSLIGMDNNKPLREIKSNPKIIDKKDFDNSCNTLINTDRVMFYDHLGAIDAQNLYLKLEYMAVAAKMDVIIIDNLSLSICGLESTGQGERKDIDIFMNKLWSLCKRTNVGILLLIQLKLNSTHTLPPPGDDERWETISLSDIKGSGGAIQTPDTVIAIERNNNDETKRRISVLKNRNGGMLGVADIIYYDYNTGRLLPKSQTAFINELALKFPNTRIMDKL